MDIFSPGKTKAELREMPTLGLAYIGDGVFELLARTYIVQGGAAKAAALHKKAVGLANAGAQAKAAKAILPLLDEEELSVFMRGRNAKPHSIPKHAKPEDYAAATGLEALFGWLYLADMKIRLAQLWEAVLIGIEETV